MVSRSSEEFGFVLLTSHNLFNETLFAFFQPTLDELLLGDVATARDDAGFASNSMTAKRVRKAIGALLSISSIFKNPLQSDPARGNAT